MVPKVFKVFKDKRFFLKRIKFNNYIIKKLYGFKKKQFPKFNKQSIFCLNKFICT